MCLECDPLRKELERLLKMNQSLQDELVGAMDTVRTVSKENSRLRGQITKEARKSARREQVEEVIEHWKSYGRRTQFPAGGTNWQIIEKALILMDDDDKGPVAAVKEAIDGVHLAPFRRFKERSAVMRPGFELANDVSDALGDEVRISRCRLVAWKARMNSLGSLKRAYEVSGSVHEAWARRLLDRLEGQPEAVSSNGSNGNGEGL